MPRLASAAAGLAAVLAIALPAQAQESATATLNDPEGAALGEAMVTETPHGLLIELVVSGLSPGEHAFHIHETGDCSAADFTSAGGHFNPDGHAHGYLDPEGIHAGDLPNIFADDAGIAHVQTVAAGLTLADLFDADGSAFVIHAGADDYVSQPSGAAGGRVACGVIEG